MASFMNDHFNPLNTILPEQLIFANGVTGLCQMLAFTVFDVGDGLLVSAPCYTAFMSDFGIRAKYAVSSTF